ncbi:peptidase U32 family protein [Anaerocolumna xylanovorans]|uniref:Putative protease n=1 Tax=Anaerocolumna xylanovorans DSM 12503 TaxID=1121345 RepID=A0A1M7YMU7_9FIRM|nr:U32 family peptidase [Anaerocolumna xylanovorans]SHO53981.1 putative protease [Anaerocolumna xylanovorans DSM 12503]
MLMEDLGYKKPELLIPASNLEVLKIAVLYGADAVYIGGEMYGLRAKAKNFSAESMKEGIAFAHAHGKKVYVTANITAHNEDLGGIEKYFKELREMKPDAIIISDPGVFEIAKETAPEIELHISTQANNVNYATYRFWHRLGAKRVVSARELSLEEIKGIRDNIPEDLEIETFVHGAMCMAHSGRCLLSNYFTGRDANRGACTHPCRWKYYLVEETRPGEYLPVEENERGTYIFNSKDLCMIEYIPMLVDAGINSFKVEGRMKTALYVASVARTYRKAIDDFFENPALYEKNIPYYREEISKCTYRQFTTGFFFGKPDADAQIYDNNTYIKEYTYLGIIGEKNKEGYYRLEQRNKFCAGDEIEVMKPDGRNLMLTVKGIRDEEGNEMESCPHPKQVIYVDLGEGLEENDILRRKE